MQNFIKENKLNGMIIFEMVRNNFRNFESHTTHEENWKEKLYVR